MIWFVFFIDPTVLGVISLVGGGVIFKMGIKGARTSGIVLDKVSKIKGSCICVYHEMSGGFSLRSCTGLVQGCLEVVRGSIKYKKSPRMHKRSNIRG
ncbi:MAG: hypothetical protein B6230_05040 [Desulfobacteraceae bacterium 4572_89]|nr:MAG: hypothetical protein B6230_05040 [Desulfobacteraceae bacterium 4572_89]